MSLFDYRVSQKIALEDPPFYGIVMAAMRKADTINLDKLKISFPEVWIELQKRYDAPGGVLSGEREQYL